MRYQGELFSFRMRPKHKEWLVARAEKEEKSIGDVLRGFIERELAKENFATFTNVKTEKETI